MIWMFMDVYGRYSSIVHGVYEPTYNWGTILEVFRWENKLSHADHLSPKGWWTKAKQGQGGVREVDRDMCMLSWSDLVE